ncbi:MAG: 6,7-dimethyl-8-ribityllumazine synthase [Dermatophilus congolensis]|nr:6,7-dimethyl-8-ribityllumazine synthase [Dermatophilus congolensis]
MAGFGSPELTLDGSGLTVAIVAASWHEEFMNALIEGAQSACAEAKVDSVEVFRVPGSFELPVVVAAAAEKFDVVVALGVVIRGGTPHFEYVSSGVTDGLMRVSLDTGKAIGFGVLTCDNEAQVADRSGMQGSRESKGYEAAAAAIATAQTLVAVRG